MLSRSLIFVVGLTILTSTVIAQEKSRSPDLRVEVELRNGSALVGVAQAGRLVERPGRGGYEVAEDSSGRTTGIRIWYYRNQDGFIFVPYRNVLKVTDLGTLTDSDTAKLKAAVREAEQARRRPKPAKEVRTADAPTREPSGDVAKAEPLTAAERKLLDDFPPSKGWSSARYGEIQRRKIVLKTQPQAGEKEFVENFDAWERARKKAGKNASGTKTADN